MRYTDIVLIKETDQRNIFGDLDKKTERRTVYAGEYSVGMTEVYQGMAVGFKPEVKFRLENWLDYHGEKRWSTRHSDRRSRSRFASFGHTTPETRWS